VNSICSAPLNRTHLHTGLRNRGADTLVLMGIWTDDAAETAAPHWCRFRLSRRRHRRLRRQFR
jgi:hypothetical protein